MIKATSLFGGGKKEKKLQFLASAIVEKHHESAINSLRQQRKEAAQKVADDFPLYKKKREIMEKLESMELVEYAHHTSTIYVDLPENKYHSERKNCDQQVKRYAITFKDGPMHIPPEFATKLIEAEKNMDEREAWMGEAISFVYSILNHHPAIFRGFPLLTEQVNSTKGRSVMLRRIYDFPLKLKNPKQEIEALLKDDSLENLKAFCERMRTNYEETKAKLEVMREKAASPRIHEEK